MVAKKRDGDKAAAGKLADAEWRAELAGLIPAVEALVDALRALGNGADPAPAFRRGAAILGLPPR